ncbi:MAG: SMP-30/gluconolactonase/LRE family protein [Rhodocyclaceae bacterium]|nr:SMP-30/gluconolactonase/LRE family protein [Rhodocyclaceae bacterium]
MLTDPAIGTLQAVATDPVALAGVNALAFDGFGNLYATRQQAALSDGVSWVNKSTGAALSLVSNLPGADHMVFTPGGQMLLSAEAPATFTVGSFTFATPNLYRLSLTYDASQHPTAAAATNLVTGPTRLNFPEGLVLLDGSNAYGAAGDLLVAEDRSGGRILRVTPAATTATVAELVGTAAALPRPEGMAFGDFGGAASAALYAATTSNSRIVRIDAGGGITAIGAAGVLNGPDNIVFGPDGRLYIGEDPQNGNPARLFAMSADGSFDLIAEGFTTLQGLAFDPLNGDLYIAEQSTDTIWRLSFTPPVNVPLPGSASLIAGGLAALCLRRRRI